MSDVAPELSTMDVGEHLCLTCGLCCDGTLFREVTLPPHEAARLRGLRLPVVDAPERIRQPCQMLEAGRCAIYAERPHACAQYRCAVLEGLEAGTVDVATARAKIAQIKALAASIRAAGGIDRDVSLLDWLATCPVHDATWRQKNAALLVDAKLLQCLVRRDLHR